MFCSKKAIISFSFISFSQDNFDYKTLVEEAVNNTRSITIDMNSDIDFASLGFEVREVIDMLKDKK